MGARQVRSLSHISLKIHLTQSRTSISLDLEVMKMQDSSIETGKSST